MSPKILSAWLAVALMTTARLAADDRSAFVGVWRFVGEVDTRADGSPAPTSAPGDAQGLLVYTADGFMSVNIMPKGRAWSTDSATLAELRETVGNGTAYAGRYEVDSANHTVTHIPSVCMEPEFQGKRLVRGYVLGPDALQLTGTFPDQGETIHFAITWARVKGD